MCLAKIGKKIILISMTRPITVRLMSEEDIPGYHHCLDIVARERRYLSMLQAPPLEASRAWVLSHLVKKHPFFVATDSEKVIAWCDVAPLDKPWFAHRGILGMGVLPDYRNQGIGARLLSAALQHSAIIGLERVELEVFASNLKAIRLYQKMGFHNEGTLQKACKSDIGYQDIILMARFAKNS